jgi:hypothetical protein
VVETIKVAANEAMTVLDVSCYYVATSVVVVVVVFADCVVVDVASSHDVIAS